MRKIEKYAECGYFGHAWFPEPNYTWKNQFGVPVVLRCERCESERREAVTFRTGELITRSYNHPYDYHYPKGQRPDKNDFRKAYLTKKRREQKKLHSDNIVPIKKRIS